MILGICTFFEVLISNLNFSLETHSFGDIGQNTICMNLHFTHTFCYKTFWYISTFVCAKRIEVCSFFYVTGMQENMTDYNILVWIKGLYNYHIIVISIFDYWNSMGDIGYERRERFFSKLGAFKTSLGLDFSSRLLISDQVGNDVIVFLLHFFVLLNSLNLPKLVWVKIYCL